MKKIIALLFFVVIFSFAHAQTYTSKSYPASTTIICPTNQTVADSLKNVYVNPPFGAPYETTVHQQEIILRQLKKLSISPIHSILILKEDSFIAHLQVQTGK